MSQQVDAVDRSHHDLPVHELVLLLETDRERGLDEAEAERRLERYGPNELPGQARSSALLRLLRQLHSPLVYVLIASGGVTTLLGEYVDAAVILGVVAVNSVIGFVQESRAENALGALRSMVQTDARVVRDGRQRTVDSVQLVPGDLVLLDAGDKVPADLRLVAQTELRVDESALTGESVPVDKDEVVLPARTPVSDRNNMAYSGTLVTGGSGIGVVVATGSSTELGEIHRLVGTAETLATPLTRKLARFSKILTVLILGLAAVTFAVGTARGEPGSEMFTAAVALAVGAIPEGLPAAVTITLAIGVSRMARRRAIIRRLPAVETLGGATVVCTDKTGTLTQNKMTVQVVWTPGQEVRLDDRPVTGADGVVPLRWSALAGANCTEATLSPEGEPAGDPTEVALLVAATELGVAPRGLPRVGSRPFSSERQYMATAHVDPDTGQELLLVKGAVERVLRLCAGQMAADGSREPLDVAAAHEAADRLAALGMRVLATAVDLGPEVSATPLVAPTLLFTGLQAMQDPPRETAAAAVGTCRTAGLQVKMVPGDHAATATAIAAQMGLVEDGERGAVLTGADLDELEDDELADAVTDTAVFARVSPEQKLRLVRALQSRDHVVAMTGDGVNDAPALRQADIGVAMGRGGTEVAKEAGDMVLTDDDFATIEAAVEEGRGVFDNLTKFIVWTLPTNTGEALVILTAILLGWELPILPTQILWINMTTAVLLGLTLAWEPKEAGIMQRPPRDPRRPLLTGRLVFRTLLVSALLTAGSAWLFEHELGRGATLEESRTAAMNVFVMVEAFYLFSCRSLTVPSWRVAPLSNPVLLLGVGLQALGQAAITYLGPMQDLFQTAAIGWEAWLRIVLVAAAVSVVVSVDKRAARGRAL